VRRLSFAINTAGAVEKAVEFPKMKKVAGTCSIEAVNVDGDELYEGVKVS
jgi:hypothetical protein